MNCPDCGKELEHDQDCPRRQTSVIGFEEWLVQLRQVAAEQYGFTEEGIVKSDWSAFRSYYDDGYTPEAAMAADASYE